MAIESEFVMESIEKWIKKLEKLHFMQSRIFRPLVLNSECNGVLMTRYLKALNPPKEFLPTIENKLTLNEAMVNYLFK